MGNRSEGSGLLKVMTVLVSGFITLVCIYLSFFVKFAGQIPIRNLITFQQNYLYILIGFVLISILFGTYIFYDKTLLDLFFFSALSQLVLAAYIMALSYAGGWIAFPRSVIAINLVIGTLGLFGWNAFVYTVYHRIRGQKRILIVGEPKAALDALSNFELMENRRHCVTHVVLSNYYRNVQKYAQEVDIVYLVGDIEEDERLRMYDYLMKENKKMFLGTQFQQLMMVNSNIMSFQDEAVIEVSMFNITDEQEFIKRLFDLVVSGVMVLLTSPIMLVTACAIKLDSPGPIFYKQERITKGGRPFNVLKFRSMSADAEVKSGPVLAASNDDRITKVGQFIRSTRIDELPQLLNVLKGDMSLVGPRPERPFFVEQFEEQNPHYYLRHNVRAGITGYAQVYGKYATDFNRKLNFDLLYIQNYSLLFDWMLLFRTIKILFDKVSAKGVDEEDIQPLEWNQVDSAITVIK